MIGNDGGGYRKVWLNSRDGSLQGRGDQPAAAAAFIDSEKTIRGYFEAE